MNQADATVTAVESVAFDGSQLTPAVGRYSYTVAGGTWSWNEGMYAVHGYLAEEVPASTEVMLRHKHPDDRSRTVAVLEAAIQDGEPFSCYHRIIDRHQRLRSVLSVGHGVKGADGRVVRVEGYLVDLTQARRAETEIQVQAALTRIAVHREVIDEAKGMVMIATGCDGAAAFRYLRRCSQDANIKVHEIAQRLVETVGPDQRGCEFVMAFLNDLGQSRRRA